RRSPPAVAAGPPRGATRREAAALALMVLAVVVAPVCFHVRGVLACSYHTPFAAPLLGVFARPHGAVSRGLSGRAWFYLGELSFALYLVHGPLVAHYRRAEWLAGVREWPLAAQWALLLAVSLAASAACYHLIETPMRRYLIRRLTVKLPDDGAATE